MVNATPRPFYPGKDPVPILKEAGWAPGPVWTDAENLVPTGIRSSDRPARSAIAIPTELSRPTVKLCRRIKIKYFVRGNYWVPFGVRWVPFGVRWVPFGVRWVPFGVRDVTVDSNCWQI